MTTEKKYDEIYPDPTSDLRVPIVVIVRNDESLEAVATSRNFAMGTGRPVIMLRQDEAQSLSAQITAGLLRLGHSA